MAVIGITGQSGSGKTTAAAIFVKHGFYHIDCDSLVHNKVYKNAELLEKIADGFGSSCVTPSGIDRKMLGRIVFSDKRSYKKLMELVMPYVISQIETEIAENSDKNILLDAPLLFEYGLEGVCTYTVGVIADNIIERICARDKISDADARQRLKNQNNADFYRRRCDFIIENNGNISELEERVGKIADTVLKENCP